MATAAAAMVAKARREVDQLFFDNEAFSPDRAVEFKPRIDVQRRYLEQLMAEGVVHEAEPGRYWWDLPVYTEMRRQRAAWTLRILVLALVVFAVVMAVQTVMRSR